MDNNNNHKIELNLNAISRLDYNAWLVARAAVPRGEIDQFDFEHLSQRVIVKWPFDQPITVEGYMALGLEDSVYVDTVVKDAMDTLAQKKSGKPST